MNRINIIANNKLLVAFCQSSIKAKMSVIGLCVIYVLSVLMKLLIISSTQAPSCYLDEFIYKENALFLWGHWVGGVSASYDLQYPPLYSLLISMSFFFSNHYLAMKVINALVISATVFPTYLLGRRYMGCDASLLLAIVIGFLPHQWIYPSFVLSENLFLPLFIGCIYYATRPLGNTKGKVFIDILITGVLAGLLFLTRYQGIIVIAALFPYYLGKLYYFEKEQAIKLLGNKWRWCTILLFVFSAISIILVWVLPDAMVRTQLISKVLVLAGVTHTTSTVSRVDKITGASFFQWTVWYVAYVILAITPLLYQAILHASTIFSSVKNRLYQGIFPLTFVICGGFGFAAVRHSYRVAYNQPIPQYVIGRYLSYIIVLLIILSCILISTREVRPSRRNKVYCAIIGIFALGFSYFSLFGSLGGAKQIPAWFIFLFNGADILAYHRVPLAVVVASFILLALFMVNSYRFPKMAQLGAVSMCFLMLSGPVYIFRATTRQTSYLSIEEYQEMRKTGGNVDVFVYPEARLTNVKFTFDFWDTQGDAQRFNFVTQGSPNIAQIVSSVPLYTKDEAKLDTYYIYAHPLDSAHLSAEGADIVAEYGLQTQDYVALSMPVVPDSMIHSKGIHEGQAWVLTSGTSGTLVATIDGQECENSIVAKQDEFWLMTIDLLENAQTYDENSIIAIYDLRKHEYTTITIGELYN